MADTTMPVCQYTSCSLPGRVQPPNILHTGNTCTLVRPRPHQPSSCSHPSTPAPCPRSYPPRSPPPLQGTNASHLAQCLGLDASRYAHNGSSSTSMAAALREEALQVLGEGGGAGGGGVTDIHTPALIPDGCGIARTQKPHPSKHTLALLALTVVCVCFWWWGDHAVCEGSIVTWSWHRGLNDMTARSIEQTVPVCALNTTHTQTHITRPTCLPALRLLLCASIPA